jgi:hypothetical protein
MPQRRSLLRVKVWLLFAVFVAGLSLFKFGPWTGKIQLAILVGAFVASFLLYALRCEGCKTREFKFLDWITWKALFAPARFCPKCGIARV